MAVIFQRRPFRMRLKGINWHEMEKKNILTKSLKIHHYCVIICQQWWLLVFQTGNTHFRPASQKLSICTSILSFPESALRESGRADQKIDLLQKEALPRQVQRKRTVGHVSGGNNVRVVLSGQEMNERAVKTAVLPCNI